ncbi:hypothetical protein ACCS67_09815 [Rhizobium brockwellii]|uniref:hypothetical protein n=1 Tax=Rhizobium brockwellii TaxID=3019932 RepID=UPI003F9D5DB0
MSGHSFSLAVIGDWRMLPRREATKIRHALWGTAVVSLGIFEIVPEDRYPSREDRDRNQPKLDAHGFDDMKLHITEAEEAGPDHGCGPITFKPSLRKVLDLVRAPGSGNGKSPRRDLSTMSGGSDGGRDRD